MKTVAIISTEAILCNQLKMNNAAYAHNENRRNYFNRSDFMQSIEDE